MNIHTPSVVIIIQHVPEDMQKSYVESTTVFDTKTDAFQEAVDYAYHRVGENRTVIVQSFRLEDGKRVVLSEHISRNGRKFFHPTRLL